MKEIKQNKNSSVIRFLAFVTALVVLVFSISVPSFAYSSSSLNGLDFSGQPIPVFSSAPSASQLKESGLCFWYNSVFQYYIGSSVSDTYCAGAYNNNSLSALSVYASSSATYYWIRNDQSNVHTDTMSQISSGLYYDPLGPSFSLDGFQVPVFSSYDEAVSAVKDWIDNPPVPLPDPQGPLDISLPAGNAIFIDITDLTGITGYLSTSTTQSHSSPFSWNSTLSYVDDIPSSGSPLGNAISWQGNGGTDVFGRYRDWKCTLIVQPNKKYIAITNPFYNSDYLDPEHEDNNFPIQIHVSNYRSYTFVALNASYQSGDGIVNNYTEEQPDVPVPGGNNTSTTGNSINDWLQNIAHSISGFFAGAIGAVTTLVSAGSDFIHSLSGLYAWLPAPVYSVLVSALILVITIGVIKVFI